MKLDDVLKGSYQRYIAADFLSMAFFDKRVPLIIDGVGASDMPKVRGKLLDCYGDVDVVCERDGEEIATTVSALQGDRKSVV